MTIVPDFHEPRLADAVKTLSPGEIAELPFGVQALDPETAVRLCNDEAEIETSLDDRNGEAVGGLGFSELRRALATPPLKAIFEQARAAGSLDITFTLIGDRPTKGGEIVVRIQAASDGAIWVFRKREN